MRSGRPGARTVKPVGAKGALRKEAWELEVQEAEAKPSPSMVDVVYVLG